MLCRVASVALLGSLVILAFGATVANASLEVFYSDVGALRLSVDGIGTNAGSGVVQAEKPAGATVKKAFIFAASTGYSSFTPPDDEVTIDGSAVAWDPAHTISSSINSVNVAADVTDLIKPKIEASSAGRVDFTIAERDTLDMDGEILAVVFDDPAARTNTVTLMYGAQSTTGDHFAIGLNEPLKPSATVTMGLGISFGYQPSTQYSEVNVNGTRLTTSAGGQDDGEHRGGNENGELLTVGGLDDNSENPSDPFATGECSEAPRCDDELYDLKPFVATDATSIEVDTLNPSNDDNIFFASLNLSAATAVVGGGLVLSPTGTRTQVGTFHFFTALAQDEHGHPEVGRQVSLKVISGPSDGDTLTGTTNSDGKASFNYSSSALGTDTVEASFVDSANVAHISNEVTQTWAPYVPNTFGGEWPDNGHGVQLYYSYGGGHRYLGNVAQGASNWNNTGTSVHISAWPGVPYAVQIPFVDVNMPDSWWGVQIFGGTRTTGETLFPDDCSACGYTRNTIELNERALDPSSDAQRTKVTTHELGHALGLEHPDGWVDDSVPSVMWKGDVGGPITETPQPYDISRVKGMYP
jgi:hypothetical protein